MTTPLLENERFPILRQPDLESCGATSLQSVYQFWGDDVGLTQVIREVGRLEEGGTLGVFLGTHALGRGFSTRIYSYNLEVFDPTWFKLSSDELVDRLAKRRQARTGKKLRQALTAYAEFLNLGGEVCFEDLTPRLIAGWLDQGIPILTGLSATYLYRCPRELADEYNDVRGDPVGHYVVLYGSRNRGKTVLVADPLHPNPLAAGQEYAVDVYRVINSILLGLLTYDANLLIIQP